MSARLPLIKDYYPVPASPLWHMLSPGRNQWIGEETRRAMPPHVYKYYLQRTRCYRRQSLKLNIRSLLPSFNDLSQIIVQHNYDFFGITETWLNRSINDNQLKINGYNLYRKDRETRGGGVCIYVKETYATHVIDGLDDAIEQIWVEIKTNKQNLAMDTVYRSPNEDVTTFWSIFEDTLSSVHMPVDKLVCTGDFSINMFNINNRQVDQMNTIMSTFDLKQIIDEPTRITFSTTTLIDLIMVNSDSEIVDTGTFDTNLSDHFITYLQIQIDASRTEPKLFEHDLYRIPFNGLYDTDNIDSKVFILEDSIVKLFDIHAPLISVRCTKPHAPWMTDVIGIMTKKNKKTKIILLNPYRKKKAYFESVYSKSDSKTCWKLLKKNKLVPDKKGQIKIPETLCNPDAINDYFVSSLPNLSPAKCPVDKGLRHTKLQLFADDTQIYGSFKPENIKAACDVVNADVGRHIHGRDIPIVEQAASLGITLESDLRFDQHMTKLLQKSYAMLKAVYVNRHFLTKQLKIVLCESLVLSLLNYADVVYSSYLTAVLK
nr:unnamed protein product [Callosobruchus analis]